MSKPERHWYPQPEDEGLIRAHLDRQRGLDPAFVRLDNGNVVKVGSDAEGEADDHYR